MKKIIKVFGVIAMSMTLFFATSEVNQDSSTLSLIGLKIANASGGESGGGNGSCKTITPASFTCTVSSQTTKYTELGSSLGGSYTTVVASGTVEVNGKMYQEWTVTTTTSVTLQGHYCPPFGESDCELYNPCDDLV